jgi:hypothetical protein
MLQISNLRCGHISAAIQSIEHLETLSLADFEAGFEGFGALQLSAHQSLRSLSLISVVPESISCNDSCELHVKLHVESMEHPVWDTVLSRLRSVTLFGHSPDVGALPSILLKAGNLFKADLRLDQLGTATAPLLLGGSLARVEELVLDCVELHAVVPAHVTWRNIYVAATHLNLHFEAVASFGEAIPAFCVRFNTLQACYPQPSLWLFMIVTVLPAANLLIVHQGSELLQLAAVVARRLPDWTGTLRMDEDNEFPEEPLTGGICFPLAQPPRTIWNILERCRCGACAPCLSRAGIMHWCPL